MGDCSGPTRFEHEMKAIKSQSGRVHEFNIVLNVAFDIFVTRLPPLHSLPLIWYNPTTPNHTDSHSSALCVWPELGYP